MTEKAQITEKFVTPGELPNAYQRELLICLIEECAEVSKRATKALRFGLEEIQPGQALSNAYRITEETGDILGIVKLLQDENIVSSSNVLELLALRKEDKMKIWLQHNKDGTNVKNTEGKLSKGDFDDF